MIFFNAIQQQFGAENFAILGFPANNFHLQQPGAKKQILDLWYYIQPGNKYKPNYEIFQKIDVNGAKEPKLYTFLKNSCPPVQPVFFQPISSLYYSPLNNNDVRWNFEKFLIDKTGKPRYRISSMISPAGFKEYIEQLLDE